MKFSRIKAFAALLTLAAVFATAIPASAARHAHHGDTVIDTIPITSAG